MISLHQANGEGRPILFIGSSRIGDAVLGSGVLARLVETTPQAPVTVACGPLALPLFADVPNLQRLHPLIRRKGGGQWWDLWKASIGQHWRVIADLRGSALAWTLRADRRLVCRAQKRREHRIEELGRQLGLDPLPAPKLWISPERDRRAALRLGEGPVLAVGPTANWAPKQWPAERFAEVVRQLTAPDGILPGARVAVFGAEAERAMAAPVVAAVPPGRLIDVIGGDDLLDAYALLRRCSFYVGNDSGMMHLAAAAGLPTLGLFGPSPDWRYGPWGARTAVVRTPLSFEELVSENPGFDHRRQECLMTGLTVERVVEAAVALSHR